jgi:hypothetical protein
LRWFVGALLLGLAVVIYYATRHYVVDELVFGATFHYWHLVPFAIAVIFFVLAIVVLFWGTGRFKANER